MSVSSKNNLNLRNQQVALGWLHYKLPLRGRKFILRETIVTHCKEIYNQPVGKHMEQPQREPGGREEAPDWELGDSSFLGFVINTCVTLALRVPSRINIL